MSLDSPQLSLQYFADLSSSKLHPASLVDLLSELENNAHFGPTSAPSALELLSNYYSLYLLSLILDQDLNEARFLLQRIPKSLLSNPQVANAAALLRALYIRDYSSIYATLSNPAWSAAIIPLRDRVRDEFRKTTFLLLSKAYTSISPASVGFYLGTDVPRDDIIEKLVEEGWEYDSASGFLRPAVKYDSDRSRLSLKDERIGKLTALVTHLSEV